MRFLRSSTMRKRLQLMEKPMMAMVSSNLLWSMRMVPKSYWSNDGTSTSGSEPQKFVSVSAQGGLYTVLLGNTALQGMSAMDPAVFAQHTNAKLRVWFKGWGQWVPVVEPGSSICFRAICFLFRNCPNRKLCFHLQGCSQFGYAV